MARQKALNARTRRSHLTISPVFLLAAMRLDLPDAPDYAVDATDEAGTLAFGDVYESLYARSGEAEKLMPLRQRLDATLADLTRTPAPKRPAWGCDALFLTPAVYARMSVLTHNPKYLQAMDTEWQRASDGLWDAGTHFPACGAFGKTMSLADESAVIAGLARVLDVMPADFPSRPRYIDQYQGMAARLITLQDTDGLWRQDIPITARAAYALAFGIHHGLLDRQTYLQPVLKAWAGLDGDIRPDGLIDADADTSGVFILAGLEIAGLNDPATPLPTPIVVHASGAMPPATERSVDAFDASNARHPAQTQLVIRPVATDPVTDDPSERSPIPASSLRASSK
jgi:hypothetical protein